MSRIALVLVLAIATVAGCTLTRSEQRKDNVLSRLGGVGQIIEPKRCLLKVAIVSRPLRDDAVESAPWRVADEQVITPELHRALDVNGLRAGLITGDLPPAVEALLKAEKPHRVEPLDITLPDGDQTLVSLGESTPQASLLFNRDGRPFGKDYQDASGWLRVTATQEGTSAVTLRLVPEIHHGQIRRSFTALPNPGGYSPQQFMHKDGQEEDALRDLAITLKLQPGQVAVIGSRADAARSLGSFLFSHSEPNSDRQLQKVLLIWASRSNAQTGSNGSSSPDLKPVDPPKT